jgi:hypothetical protein
VSRPARHAHYAKPVSLTEADRLLPKVWVLEDVPDVELLCRGVLAEVRPRNMNGDADVLADRDEVLLFLFEQVVVIRGKYLPADHPGILFRPFLYERLRWRLRDHYRHLEGRRGEKPKPDSLDRPLEPDVDSSWRIDPADPLDRDDLGARRLGESLAERQVGSQEARSDALLRFLGDSGGELLREAGELGDGAGEAAAGRSREPGEDNDREEIAA